MIRPLAKVGFLFLVCSQTLHSLEEYRFSLWDVWPPARLVSMLFSDDLAVGFAVANATIVAFGWWSYLFPVRRSASYARGLMWVWIAIELGNGVGHGLLAINAQGYFPGVATAPLLIAAAWFTAAQLVRGRSGAGT